MWLSLLLQGYSINLLSAANTGTIATDLIQFVVTNHQADECSFLLDASASVLDLKKSVAGLCTVPSRFDIQLFGKTIVFSNTSINETIAENGIIHNVANELFQIWGNGFRIPISIHPIFTVTQNMTVFESLSELFGGPLSNVYEFEWYRFIIRCCETGSCIIQDLCDRFSQYFSCENGQLSSIKLRQKLTGHIDLNFLPNTVVSLLLARNSFTEIYGLDQLAGKRLRHLDVRGNPLEIDLEPLTKASAQSIINPLTYLRVNVYQISSDMIGIRMQKHPENHRAHQEGSRKVHRAAVQWFPSSILDCMTLGDCRFSKTIDGLVRQESRQQRSDIFCKRLLKSHVI